MNYIKLFFLLYLLSATTIYYYGCNASTPKGSSEYTIKESGSSVSLSPGETFKVCLKSNPTTGYVWTVSSLDKNILNISDKTYIPEKNNNNIVGSGGTDVFTFKAESPGSTDLEMVYHRPWEKNKKPAKSFTLKAEIKE